MKGGGGLAESASKRLQARERKRERIERGWRDREERQIDG